MNRLFVSAAALLFGAIPAHAQSLVSGKVQTGTPSYGNDQNVPLSLDATGALRVTGAGSGGSTGGSAASPTFTTPAGVTRTRQTCTLPAYASGGNIVCTDQAGAQTTTACAANTACLVSASNANRKTALATVRTAGVTCDVGYSATVAPGNAIGIDGAATTGGQGGSLNETPAHVGTYYAACPAAATLVFVQGQ